MSISGFITPNPQRSPSTTVAQQRPTTVQRQRCVHHQSGGVVVVLLFLLLIAAAVGTVYRYYHLHSQELKVTHQRMADMRNEISRATLAASAQQRQFEQGMSRMASIESSLAAIPSLDAGHAGVRLSLSETEHLLQAAQWQLQLYQDTAAALFALEKAHERLDKFRDHRALERVALSVRRLISVMKTLQQPDIEGVLRSTQRLQNLILSLPPVRQWQDNDLAKILNIAPTQGSAQPRPRPGAAAQPAALVEQEWYQRLWSYVVEVRPATLLGHLSQDSHNQTLLWENLLLLVSRVQSAALHRDRSVYQSTLDEILRLINAAYPGELKQKSAVTQLVGQLRLEVISVNLPDLTAIRKDLANAVDKYDQTLTGRPTIKAPRATKPAPKKTSVVKAASLKKRPTNSPLNKTPEDATTNDPSAPATTP